ncbi:MAG TPA: glycosyltransferase [Candidatus Binatia bacterium]|nr:glycosyltransferase [Candidatus Binatia bacterium]
MRWAFFHFETRLDPARPHAGAERALIAVAGALARRGHAVTVVGRLRADTTAAGVRYLCAGGPDAYDVRAGLARIGADCDVLVSTLPGAALEASLAYPGIRRRLWWPNVTDVAAAGLPVERLVEIADHVAAVSADQAAGFVAAGVPAARVTVVPNGVDPEVFRPDPAVARVAGRVVFAGALVPDKGIDVLLHAMPAVRALIPEAELVVCGSAALWEREPFFDPAAVAAELGCVRFRGALAEVEVAAELRGAALAVVPTPPERWREALPLVAIEAQACGTPVVVTRSGGLPETVLPEETGWLVERATPEHLAAAIVRALRDPERLARMGERAAAWVRATFSWERTAAALERLAAPAHDVAFVTTWRQPCGLARYAERLVGALDPPGGVLVLAEETSAAADGGTRGVTVERVWRRGEPLDGVVAAALRAGVRLVHVNHHGALFGAHVSAALAALRARGVRTVVTLHAPNQVAPEIAAIGAAADAVLVHGDGPRLEVVANGVPEEKVHVVPHGVDPVATADAAAVRAAMGLKPSEKLVASVGFLQPHKGFDEAVRAVAALRARGLPVRYLVLGGVAPGDAGGAAYRDALRAEAARLGIADAVTIADTYLPDAAVATYLRAADVIALPYRTSWWEASGAARDALASGRPVVTSSALAFQDLGDAVFRTTGAFPLATALAAVLANPALAAALTAAGARRAARDAWPRVAAEVAAIHRRLRAALPPAPRPDAPRVLLLLREHAGRTGGGDASVAAALAAGVDPARLALVRQEGGRVAGDVDLVHLVNFSTYAATRAHAERAVALGLPYVVSAFYEDWPSFKVAAEAALQRYRVRLGLAPSVDLEAYVRMHAREQADMLAANRFVAAHAQRVIATAGSEAARLEHDFPGVRAQVIPLGAPEPTAGDPDAFRSKFGTRDFVLCVGRLEPRKNQLALLEALADDPIDVVLATGGVAYRTDYLEACQGLRRRGRTLYLPRLTAAELAGAYRAARVHVLPSWFELPGLATLEALRLGCAVVASDRGTLREYLGDTIPYAAPDDPEAIRRAVAAAGGWDFAPARARAAGFGAARYAEAWTALYEELLAAADRGRRRKPPRRPQAVTGSDRAEEIEGLSAYQAAFVRHYRCPRVFAVVSWGCAATAWLATTLNRHPDVYCVHAGNLAWHVLGGGERLDGIDYLRIVAAQGHGHAAAGDVHGVSRHHVPELRRRFGPRFNAAVVVRDPLPRLRSQLALFEEFAAHETWDLAYVDGLIARCGVRLPASDYRCRFFVHAANMLNAILEEGAVGRIFRSEDLTGDADALGAFVEEITRGTVRPEAEWLKAAVGGRRINVHAGSRPPQRLEDWQIEVVHRVVDPRSWERYEALGYAPRAAFFGAAEAGAPSSTAYDDRDAEPAAASP